jgi:hypothetical protein
VILTFAVQRSPFAVQRSLVLSASLTGTDTDTHLQPSGVTHNEVVGWTAPRQPLWAVLAAAVTCVETQAGNDDKRMSLTGINRDPSTGAALPVMPQFVGWSRRMHSAD